VTSNKLTAHEKAALARAVELARNSRHVKKGNPQVGAVVLDVKGRFVAEGAHQGKGTPHAEALALALAGKKAKGGTLCVSLEPCDHFGATPPCTTAILRAGIKRVVYGAPDLTQVESSSQLLIDSGVSVATAPPDSPEGIAAREVTHRWAFAKQSGRTWVTWKVATSIDGSLASGGPGVGWFTSEQSRSDVHDLRELADAVIVGASTVIADDSRLTARTADGKSLRPVQPIRVVVGDSEMPPKSNVNDHTAPTWLEPRLEPLALLEKLHSRGLNHVLLEAGPTLSNAFLDAGLIDEVVWFLAPVWFGISKGVGRIDPKRTQELVPLSVVERGGDIRVHGYLASL
jgi:diaminohydroxyphosphoribosylaminopyrimidine deaminase/5-amino-6-(5-phosphoribosylamino)uracil reductase